MRPLTELCELARKHSTDKGGRHNTYNFEPCHGTHEYTPHYHKLFSKQRALVQVGMVLDLVGREVDDDPKRLP